MISGEKTILERVQRGDAEAFEQIYNSYVSKMFRFAFLKIGDKETAEDIASETFMKFWFYAQKNRINGETAEPMLYKIARNLIIDFYRKKELVTTYIDEDIMDTVPDVKSDFLSRMINQEEVEEMMLVLKELKDEYQEIIILRFVEEMSIEEVVEITGKSSGSVRVLSHRALKSLERVMRLRENKIV